MRIGGKEIPPPFNFWVPDYSDFRLPFKPDGTYYRDPEDYEQYLNWLVFYVENSTYRLSPHHEEILADPAIRSWDAEGLGLWLGAAAISEYYMFVEPMFPYPEDFLTKPEPERVCDPETVEWNSNYYDEDDELREGMVDLQTYLIFDFMCWQAEKEYAKNRRGLPPNAPIFSDIGWRPLLKGAISRTDDWRIKRNTLKLFHKEYDDLSRK